jgi:hypothetical protein
VAVVTRRVTGIKAGAHAPKGAGAQEGS